MAHQILTRIGIYTAIAIALFLGGPGSIPGQEKIPLTFLIDDVNPAFQGLDTHAGYYALVTGKVQAEGLKLDIKPFWAWDATRMMLAGEGDVGTITINGYLMAKDRGGPLVMIAVSQIPLPGVPNQGLFVQRASGIKTPKALQGKKLGIAGLVSASAIYYRAILQHKYGADTGKITWVDKGNPELAVLLKKGEIDAAILWAAVAEKAMKDPALEALFVGPDAWKEMTSMPFITVIIAAKKSLVEKQPEAVKSLLKALKLSKKYGEENRQAVLAEAQKKHGPVDPNRTIIQPFELTEELKEAVKLYAKYALEQKVIRKEIPLADLFADLK